jgi:hypothetical protein
VSPFLANILEHPRYYVIYILHSVLALDSRMLSGFTKYASNPGTYIGSPSQQFVCKHSGWIPFPFQSLKLLNFLLPTESALETISSGEVLISMDLLLSKALRGKRNSFSFEFVDLRSRFWVGIPGQTLPIIRSITAFSTI